MAIPDDPRRAERLARESRQVVDRPDPSYPPRLREIADPPAALFFRGELPVWDRVVAIVGTRRCTAYGRRLAAGLAGDLARSGVLVLSGLAWGIDAAAHAGALGVGGRTAAIVAHGPDRCYPAANRALYGRILDAKMAILGEYPPGSEPLRWRFAARNRLVAAIAHAVVVVEAPDKSGSLITARFASEGAAEVMVVPGPADSPTFAGSHALLRDGARLVTSARDILEDLGWSAAAPTTRTPAEGDPQIMRILEALESEGATADMLAERVGWSRGAVMLALTALELQGRVSSHSGGVYVRCSGHGSGHE